MQNVSNMEKVLTELDHARLVSLLARMNAAGGPQYTADMAQDLLDSAMTVPAQSIPPNVATMRSRVRLRDGKSGSEMDLTLTYPTEADATAGRISVLSPLGLSLIGCQQGHTIQWQGPDKIVHRGTLAEILYQPEAAGDYGT
jgi:regulator of nucleoside diphosphate kinase